MGFRNKKTAKVEYMYFVVFSLLKLKTGIVSDSI